jgi:hypothetical protein
MNYVWNSIRSGEMEAIKINWHGPYDINNIGNYDVSNSIGIYAVYRVWGGKESLLYIGKTERSFLNRITEHHKEWVGNVRGQIRLRFGTLEFEQGKHYSSKKLSDVEALLIILNTPSENTMCRYNYFGREGLTVINAGRRGLIKQRVSTEELVW